MTPEEIISTAMVKIGRDPIDSIRGHPDLAEAYLVHDSYLMASWPWSFPKDGPKPGYYEMALIARIAAEQAAGAEGMSNERVDALFRLAAAELRLAKLADPTAATESA